MRLSDRVTKVKFCTFYGVLRYTATYKRRKHVPYGYMKDELGLECVSDRTVLAEAGSMRIWHVTPMPRASAGRCFHGGLEEIALKTNFVKQNLFIFIFYYYY